MKLTHIVTRPKREGVTVTALCGKRRKFRYPAPPERPVCPACSRELLRLYQSHECSMTFVWRAAKRVVEVADLAAAESSKPLT